MRITRNHNPIKAQTEHHSIYGGFWQLVVNQAHVCYVSFTQNSLSDSAGPEVQKSYAQSLVNSHGMNDLAEEKNESTPHGRSDADISRTKNCSNARTSLAFRDVAWKSRVLLTSRHVLCARKHVYEIIYCSSVDSELWCTYFNVAFIAAGFFYRSRHRLRVSEHMHSKYCNYGRERTIAMMHTARSELHLCRARLYCMSRITYNLTNIREPMSNSAFISTYIMWIYTFALLGRAHCRLAEICLLSASTNLSFSRSFNKLNCNFRWHEQLVLHRRHENGNKMICSVVWICKQLFSLEIGFV